MAWSERLELAASDIAAGKELDGWHLDSRGIVSIRVRESMFNDPDFLYSALYQGFEPGGDSLDMYVVNRVIKPWDVKLQKRTLKLLANAGEHEFTLRIDTSWDEVVRRVQGHTDDCWLSTELATALWRAREFEEAMKKKIGFHCVELWHGDKIVAANIGYTLGDIYSGFTKFYEKSEGNQYSGVGIMLSSALGAWLHRQGFKLYAMGQDASYKSDGVFTDAYLLRGNEWLTAVRNARDMENPPSLASRDNSSISVHELVSSLN